MKSLKDILFEILTEDKKGLMKTQWVDTGKLTDLELDKLLPDDNRISDKYAIWLVKRYFDTVKKPNTTQNDQGKYVATKEGAAKIKRFFEDIGVLRTDLEVFDRHKNKFPKKDLMQYPDFPSFEKDAMEVSNNLSLADKEKGKQKSEKYSELYLGDVDGFKVYKLPQKRPDLKDVACDLGAGTRWCTAGSTDNYFVRYNNTDTLYVFVKGNEKYQFHYKGNEFMDKNNSSMRGPEQEELKSKFLQFIEDKEGRFQGTKDLSNRKIGEFNTPEGKLPLYKVGDKFYTDVDGEQLFYNYDTNRLKYADGRDMSAFTNAFREPYMSFLKAVYSEMKKEGIQAKFYPYYRLFLNLDVPQDKVYAIKGEVVDLSNTDLTTLPGNIHILGDLDISDTNIKVPSSVKVDGQIIK